MNSVDGVVERLEGDFAWVRTYGQGSACGACSRKGGCGAITDGGAAGSLLKLSNGIRAHPGDAVVIEIADGEVLRAAWLAYGIPLLLAMTGAIVAKGVTGSDAVAVAAMLGGLAGGFIWMGRRRCAPGHPGSKLSMGFKELS